MNTISNSREPRLVPLDTVKPYVSHARTHSPAKIAKLKALVAQFGQVVPILVDGNNVIISGHALHTVMSELGAGEISVISIAGRTDAEIRALRLAMNRLPLEADWHVAKLRGELQELVGLGVDIDLTGFDVPEIKYLLDFGPEDARVDAGPVSAIGEMAVSVLGDVWTCGRHRIGCGDSTNPEFIDKVRAGAVADVGFIDPVRRGLAVSALAGNLVQSAIVMTSTTKVRPSQSVADFGQALKALHSVCTASAFVFVCCDWRHIAELVGAGRECRMELCDLCVWAKPSSSTGSLYRSQHEFIGVFNNHSGGGLPDIPLRLRRRGRSNLWGHRGAGLPPDAAGELADPRITAPVTLIADALRDVTKRGATVADTFIGSGSTLLAAEETGRTCFGVEVDPLYVDIAIRRWQAKTGGSAVHAFTGERFDKRRRGLVSATGAAA